MTESLIALGWSQLWQATIVLALVFAVTKTSLRRYPKWCHLLWVLAFIKCLVPPIWPSLLGLFSWCQVRVANVAILDSAAFGERSLSWVTDGSLRPWLLTVLAVWCAGVVFRVVQIGLRYRALQKTLREKRVETPPRAQVAFESAQSQLLSQPTSLVVVDDNLGPSVLGLFRHTVILPLRLVENLSAEDIEPMIAHELVHIRRGDLYSVGLRTLFEIVWWFHPLTWFCVRESVTHCERSADQDVLANMRYLPERYAQCLMHVLESKVLVRPLVGSASLSAFEITKTRLQSVLGFTAAVTRDGGYRARAVVAVLLGLVLLPGAAVDINPEWMVPTHEYQPDLPPGYKCWSAEQEELAQTPPVGGAAASQTAAGTGKDI